MIPPEALRRVVAVAEAKTESFVQLTRVAALDPGMAFRGADLRGVVFTAEDADLRGFDFRGADLRGADMRAVRRWPLLAEARLEGALLPPAPPYDAWEANKMILRGETPPPAWWPKIKKLRFSNERFYDLDLLAGLTCLQELSLNNTQVSDLAPLAGLTSLQSLWLHNTQVSDLAPLAGLTCLQRLWLHNTQVSDLAPLAGLASMQELSLNNTQVSDLAPIASLANLQWLTLDNTQVSDLAPLAGRRGLDIYWRGRKIDSATLTPPNTPRPRAARRR
jgi:Leucine-rich repeat (LRR) protein